MQSNNRRLEFEQNLKRKLVNLHKSNSIFYFRDSKSKLLTLQPTKFKDVAEYMVQDKIELVYSKMVPVKSRSASMHSITDRSTPTADSFDSDKNSTAYYVSRPQVYKGSSLAELQVKDRSSSVQPRGFLDPTDLVPTRAKL